MLAFQVLQIDMIDSSFFFFFLLQGLISGFEKKHNTALISLDSPLNRNSRRDNRGLCDIIPRALLWESKVEGEGIYHQPARAYRPVTVINILAIKGRRRANR